MMKKLLAVLGAASLATALSGCGGGGGNDTTPAPAATAGVPASATATVAGLISYLQALIATGSAADTLQPIDLTSVTLPTDDTASPTPLD